MSYCPLWAQYIHIRCTMAIKMPHAVKPADVVALQLRMFGRQRVGLGDLGAASLCCGAIGKSLFEGDERHDHGRM